MSIKSIFKYSSIFIIMLIAGEYGWYLMATEINRHANTVAAQLIQDTMSSSIAYDVEKLHKLENHIREGRNSEALEITEALIDGKIYQLQSCVTEICRKVNEPKEE